jgi:hypothetical protein
VTGGPDARRKVSAGLLNREGYARVLWNLYPD